MEKKFPSDDIFELLHAEALADRLKFEDRLQYELHATERLYSRFQVYFNIALVCIVLATGGVLMLLWLVWESLPSFASARLTLVLYVWGALVIAVPPLLLLSAFSNRRKVYEVERRAFDLEQAIFREFIDKEPM